MGKTINLKGTKHFIPAALRMLETDLGLPSPSPSRSSSVASGRDNDLLEALLREGAFTVTLLVGRAAILARGFVKCFLRVPKLLLQLPWCPGKQGEISGNCLLNLLPQ